MGLSVAAADGFTKKNQAEDIAGVMSAAHRAYHGLRHAVPWKLLVAGSFLTDIGFTMALFTAELAFEPPLLSAVKPAIMAGIAARLPETVMVGYFGPTQRATSRSPPWLAFSASRRFLK